MDFLIGLLFILAAIVGGLLLHASMKVQQFKVQPPPLWLYGFHEDGTPIKGWHKARKGKK